MEFFRNTIRAHSYKYIILNLEYAQVLRMLGDGRLALQCYDDVARTGLIRGTMRRRVWINTVRNVP
jgi:initiation factor 1A